MKALRVKIDKVILRILEKLLRNKIIKNKIEYLNSLERTEKSPNNETSSSATILGVFVFMVALIGLITHQDVPRALLIFLLIGGIIFMSDIIYYIINIPRKIKNRK